MALNKAVIGMSPAANGNRYLLVASDGSVTPFGAATPGNRIGTAPGLVTGIAGD